MNLDLTPTATAAHWSAAYVGRAWTPQYTCWHLVCDVQARVFGRTLPEYDVSSDRAASELRAVVGASGWQRAADAPRDGDVMLMHGPTGPHIGLVAITSTGPSLLHNVGDVQDGAPRGGVGLVPLDRLGSLHYGRLELWRAPP